MAYTASSLHRISYKFRESEPFPTSRGSVHHVRDIYPIARALTLLLRSLGVGAVYAYCLVSAAPLHDYFPDQGRLDCLHVTSIPTLAAQTHIAPFGPTTQAML